MNQTVKETPIVQLSVKQEKFAKKMLHPFKFKLFTLTQVPLGFIAGMKLETLEGEQCTTSLPYKFLNKNPFKSTYFAAQSMAAELSTAALGMLHLSDHLKTIAFIIVDMEAKFIKKATDKVTFTCVDGEMVQKGIEKAYETGESVEVKMKTEGKMPNGQVVSTFYFTWSFKKRK
ncbi:DUF4442 domain-containing protein [Flammeovirga yaeyamensis]|uniref:DUF4442 domain-containing protein n=1 Tax=Flammeovirga yaeyamensis TaxID=367791 RepID=A0AAX1N231_9BACT|nr:DUF4442 domain-containing protein [Flammeovirga yaeyamensis]MBB3696055.1 hypothetical protein [Flammeovirga yaeyamensis]NMF34740.1 DUF4442 domain-containing protein [Flammeovirga yaeyamensis]QWG00431.1 DUF4442 domain-containing protein [Flammeovirga yaeyamensis]